MTSFGDGFYTGVIKLTKVIRVCPTPTCDLIKRGKQSLEVCNSSPWKADAGRLQVRGYPGLYSCHGENNSSVDRHVKEEFSANMNLVIYKLRREPE